MECVFESAEPSNISWRDFFPLKTSEASCYYYAYAVLGFRRELTKNKSINCWKWAVMPLKTEQRTYTFRVSTPYNV